MVAKLPTYCYSGLIWVFCILCLLGTLTVSAQTVIPDSSPKDSIRTIEMTPLVITATRSQKMLEDVAVPTTIITSNIIQREGALRLGDVLANQMGIALFDDHGTGIQIQGFASDYTLILLDGEPVIGRTAGTLDIDRITLKGLSHLEIVRGPSSSLYGSEALAGVINLIPSPPKEKMEGAASFRIGSYATSDMTLQMEGGRDWGGMRVFVNRYASGGYDLSPNIYGPTTPSFSDWTGDLRAHIKLSERIKVKLGARGTFENQESVFASQQLGQTEERYNEEGARREWSIHPEIDVQLSKKIRLNTTLYRTSYRTETHHRRQEDKFINYEDNFDQTYSKAEIKLDMLWNTKHLSNIGGGVIGEQLGGTRYPSTSEPESSHRYFFIQHEWLASDLIHFNTSARYDDHSDYASRFTPKLSVIVRPSDQIRLRASIGSGFKAPAFRQLYLAFTNSSGGYSVFGSIPMSDGINQLEANGLIQQRLLDIRELDPLRAENSVAYNVGGSITLRTWLTAQLNLFHNNVTDLIETQPVAQKTNGAFVYGYFNLAKIYTRGIESELRMTPQLNSQSSLDISLGYQYLQARDREIVDAINEGTVYGRSPSGRDYRLGIGDYTGLFGRSPHSASLRAAYINSKIGLTASAHGRWRSRYGYRDLDGNLFANRPDEFVPHYAVLGATISKKFTFVPSIEFIAQVGLDNVFNHTYPTLVPSLPGRRGYTSLQFNF
ncbi:MAG: TonB-dependent receptor [Bacteroidetes bacterium]|nr:TonB-dependent receptor [Bacteroidota bacterium]